jgi:hypothetical protein
MKALLVSAAAIGLLSAAPAYAQAGPTSTADGSADAYIVQPITVTADNATGGAIHFGKIAAIHGTVTVNPNSTYSSTPDMIVDPTGIGAAHFNVTGEAGLNYNIALVSNSTSIDDGAGPGAPMNVALNLGSTSGSIGDGGFDVGGVLSVATGQAPGTYTGSFQVQVQYN